jgi:hypothetical protein
MLVEVHLMVINKSKALKKRRVTITSTLITITLMVISTLQVKGMERRIVRQLPSLVNRTSLISISHGSDGWSVIRSVIHPGLVTLHLMIKTP